MNRLPEKLSTLRKHFGYPQGDIAKHLDVQVTEYMNWENGNSLPDILVLKRLADLFHVSLDSLVNNHIEVTLPDLEGMSTMLNIPFISTNGLREEEDVADNILPVHAAKPYETLQQDSVSSSERTAELTKTESLQETEVVPIEPTVTEVIPLVKEERKESKPKLGIYAVAALALLFILAGIYILLNQGGSKDNPLVVSDVNRLAETTNGTIFIKDDGSLETWGRVDHLELLKDIVQISSYDNHMVALYKDGRIFTSSNDTVSRSWKNNIMVAAGNTHVVALGRDKKVSCSGVSAACKVDTWKNIEQIYAGDNITAGIDNNHILYIASDNDAYATLNERGNVSSVAIGRMGIALCNDDGSVALYRPDGTKVDLVDLQGVKNVCIGESFVAGIDSNGEVKVYGAEASFSEAVKKMKNSMYLASDRDTLVALDRNLNIFGAGENTNKQYGEVEIEPTPSATPETKTKLASVQNIHFDQSTANVQIKWDAVENANRYAISISPALDRTIPRTASTSASVPSSSFQKDVTYTITIIAYPKDDDKYEESEASVAQFTYIPKTIQLNSPTQVQALTSVDSWNIVWEAVEHADYYMVSIDDEEPTKVTETIYEYKFPNGAFEHLSEHIVRVRAGSDNEKYEESSPTEANLIYEAPTYNLDIDFVDNGTNITINAKPYILQVGVGSYSVKQIAEELAGKNIVPEGFELVYPDNMVNIQSDTKIIIAVRVKKVEPISTNEPEPEVSPEVNEEALPNG